VEVEALTMEHLAGDGMPLEVLDLAPGGASWRLGEVRCGAAPGGGGAVCATRGWRWVVLGVGGGR